MLTDFYQAFSPVAFTLLGLWFVVVQTRYAEWSASPAHRRRATAVSLHFALPGLMSLLSLVDADSEALWRVTFAASAAAGLGALVVMERASAGVPSSGVTRLAHALAEVLYAAIALVALAPAPLRDAGIVPLRLEAVLLSLLVFLGVNLAWLLMFDEAGNAPRS